MSIDIGSVVARVPAGSDLSPEETLTMHRAESLWRESPDLALAGHGLFSAEANFDMDRSTAIVALVTEVPNRFLALASHLSPVIQDILYQYYLLGRTYAQIGSLLFPSKSLLRQSEAVKDGNRIGVRALGVVIRYNGPPPSTASVREWHQMLQWNPDRSRRTVCVRAPRDLGNFIIVPNGQLGELFAPSWSVLGPSASGLTT